MTHCLERTNSGLFHPVTKRYCWPEGINATGRRMLFSGPDYLSNHQVHVEDEHRHVGVEKTSPEGTSEIDYVWRPSWQNPPPLLRKHQHVGEVGWGIPLYNDRKLLLSGQQIKRGEFRTMAEDKHTHMYQTPWTSPPSQSSRPFTAPARYRSRPFQERNVETAFFSSSTYSTSKHSYSMNVQY